MNKRRAVAFLDILGFKDLLLKNDLSVVASKYAQAVNVVNIFNQDIISDHKEPTLFESRSTPSGWCIKRIFSDSIILVSHEDTEESCLRLLIYVWRLMQACFSIKLPFRGGIAYDEMFVDEKNEMFLGRGLTKAYELEGCQQWIGVAIDSDLQKAYPNIFLDENRPYLKNIFLEYPVPFKGGATRSLHTINWRFNLIIEEGTRSIMPYSLDRGVIEKVKNTLSYAKAVIDSKEIYMSDKTPGPIEIRSFYCGSKEPPFPHGDDL